MLAMVDIGQGSGILGPLKREISVYRLHTAQLVLSCLVSSVAVRSVSASINITIKAQAFIPPKCDIQIDYISLPFHRM